MEINTLKRQIKDNKLDNFYIFTGDEWAVQKLYIKQISKISGLDVRYVDSIKSIYKTIINKTFVNKYYCYVIRDDIDILREDKLQEQLLNNLMGHNILILLLTNCDKRTKAFKVLRDKYIVFDKLPSDILRKYVLKELPRLTIDNVQRLVDICDCDYGRILLEIDKMKCFAQQKGSDDWDAIFNTLVEDKTIYRPPQDAVFDLVDAFLKRQVKRSYELLQNCYDSGEANLVILSNIYSAAKQLLQVQSCDDDTDIMDTCGITYPQLQAALSRKNRYSIRELINILKLIREVEKGIKIGEIDDSLSVEYVLINAL